MHRSPRASAAQHTHQCMAVGCQATVQGNWLMCLPHWRQVPKRLRDEVWQAWRDVGRSDGARSGARDRHARAVQAAIDAVHAKQLGAKARADDQTPPLF